MVRIDGTFGTEPYGLPNGQGKPEKLPDAVSSDKPKGAETDRVVSSTLAPLIRDAAAVEEVNAQAVEAARRALQAGELDTPDAVRRAAQGILDLGL